jgi:hypothetical protein
MGEPTEDEAPAPAVFSRAPSLVVRDVEADNAELRRENEYMAREMGDMHREIAELLKRVPTPEEMEYLRERKAADDNARWLWRTIKAHAPWLVIVFSMFGSAFYWIATHTITIGSKTP